ncbi:hypothetical protein [Chamaesiphon sp.]|uniref:hypothetical protein n=1 Tax=Chamaesiphon sp. TaxID=2814140 RepID=UPI003594143E
MTNQQKIIKIIDTCTKNIKSPSKAAQKIKKKLNNAKIQLLDEDFNVITQEFELRRSKAIVSIGNLDSIERDFEKCTWFLVVAFVYGACIHQVVLPSLCAILQGLIGCCSWVLNKLVKSNFKHVNRTLETIKILQSSSQ